jgi:hypothetical protein
MMKTKICIFDSNVKSVLLFGCEVWKVTNQITNKLQMFVNQCWQRKIGIRWPKIIRNTKLWEATGEKPIV